MNNTNNNNAANQVHKQSSATAMYKREPEKRVFVNRTVQLGKIQFFGFDMDYTLAVYKSPIMESTAYKMVIERLIQIGYPSDIANFKYDSVFSVRGIWFDSHFGNLLKMDGFGNILAASHGLQFLTRPEIEAYYPNSFLQLSDRRIYVLNTLFNLPDTHLIASLIEFFDRSPNYTQTGDKTGVYCGDVIMSYKSIFQDLRSAMDDIHGNANSALKKAVLSRISEFVEKDDRLGHLLTQLRNSERKTFLLTNSDYEYTKHIMTYLLGGKWREYFDMIIVDAKKPRWFAEGTVFREVNTETGALKIGEPTKPLQKGAVYSGGSCEAFRLLIKARGKDVLYIGDHIFGDVLKSKKTRGWRTFLVVPELSHELAVWTGKREHFEQLQLLESELADMYRDLDANTRDKPEIKGIMKAIRDVAVSMDQEYSVFGSLFRSGSRTTFFASQVERYADLYASSCCNLVHYPTFYMFRPPMLLMPHESTVEHTAIMPLGEVQKMSQHASKVRGWNQRMAKAPTVCSEEDEEANGGSSTQGSTPRASRQNGAESDEEPMTAREEEEATRARADTVLNDTDVIVPKSSFVDETH